MNRRGFVRMSKAGAASRIYRGAGAGIPGAAYAGGWIKVDPLGEGLIRLLPDGFGSWGWRRGRCRLHCPGRLSRSLSIRWWCRSLNWRRWKCRRFAPLRACLKVRMQRRFRCWQTSWFSSSSGDEDKSFRVEKGSAPNHQLGVSPVEVAPLGHFREVEPSRCGVCLARRPLGLCLSFLSGWNKHGSRLFWEGRPDEEISKCPIRDPSAFLNTARRSDIPDLGVVGRGGHYLSVYGHFPQLHGVWRVHPASDCLRCSSSGNALRGI